MTWCTQHKQPVYQYKYVDRKPSELGIKFTHSDPFLTAKRVSDTSTKYYLYYEGTIGNGYSIFKTKKLLSIGEPVLNNMNVIFDECVNDLNEVKGGKPKRQRKSRRKSRKSKHTRRR